jgi:hypothetical protein
MCEYRSNTSQYCLNTRQPPCTVSNALVRKQLPKQIARPGRVPWIGILGSFRRWASSSGCPVRRRPAGLERRPARDRGRAQVMKSGPGNQTYLGYADYVAALALLAGVKYEQQGTPIQAGRPAVTHTHARARARAHTHTPSLHPHAYTPTYNLAGHFFLS